MHDKNITVGADKALLPKCSMVLECLPSKMAQTWANVPAWNIWATMVDRRHPAPVGNYVPMIQLFRASQKKNIPPTSNQLIPKHTLRCHQTWLARKWTMYKR